MTRNGWRTSLRAFAAWPVIMAASQLYLRNFSLTPTNLRNNGAVFMSKSNLPKTDRSGASHLRRPMAPGPCTVRRVWEQIVSNNKPATHRLKLMQIMFEKGLVERMKTQRSHVLPAKRTEEKPSGRSSGIIVTSFLRFSSKTRMQALA